MVSVVICSTEANSIQLCTGVSDASCLIDCCITVCLRRVNITITDTIRRRTIRQHNHILRSNAADLLLIQEVKRTIQTVFHIGALIHAKTVNGCQRLVIAVFACSAGNIYPSQSGVTSCIKSNDCQHSACICISAAVRSQELTGSCLGCGQSVQIGINAAVILTRILMAISSAAFCAGLHRTGGVDHHDNSAAAGLLRDAGAGPDLQRNVVGIIHTRDRGCSLGQGNVGVVDFMSDRTVATGFPVAIFAVGTIDNSAVQRLAAVFCGVKTLIACCICIPRDHTKKHNTAQQDTHYFLKCRIHMLYPPDIILHGNNKCLKCACQTKCYKKITQKEKL